MTDEGRELKVIHGGVVELSYQPVRTARAAVTLADHPFGTTSQTAAPDTQAPAEQAAAGLTQQDAQVQSRFYLTYWERQW